MPDVTIGDTITLRYWTGAGFTETVGTVEDIEPGDTGDPGDDVVIIAEDPDMAYFRNQIVSD